MKRSRDSVWQRRGTSWIWDNEALSQICHAKEVWSLRQFINTVGKWSEDLPSNNNQTLVVGGLEGCLDLLSPEEAEKWLIMDIKSAVLSFQDFWEGQAALIFWLPGGGNRMITNPATGEVTWRCAAPHNDEQLDFGRIVWSETHEYPQEILLHESGKPAGLFHLRIT